jgi:hypothetical protein
MRSHVVAACTVALAGAIGCRTRPQETAPAPSASAAVPAVPAPTGLLVQGAIRNPAEVYRALKELVGGRTRLLPTGLALAVATTAFDAPLSAGLVDEASPAALAVVDAGSPGGDLVLCMHLTSGAELVASLTRGSDAKFVERRAAGVTLLDARAGGATIDTGIVGDYLVLSQTERGVLVAGPYLARTVAPGIGEGPALELVAPKNALTGSLTTGLYAAYVTLRKQWLEAEAEERAHHGGRAADFADPAAVIAAANGVVDGALAVLGSTRELRMTAALGDPAPVLRFELSPDTTGAARELTESLEVGSLSPALGLPSSIEVALVSRSSAQVTSMSDRVEKLFGDRLPPRDRDVLRAWFADLARGIGPVHAVGLYGQGLQAFALGTQGDSDALRRAVRGLPGVATLRAVAEPLRALAGRVEFSRPKGPSNADPATLVFRVFPRAEPTTLSLSASSSNQRVAAVAGVGDVGARLQELLEGSSAALGGDPTIAAAIARAGDQADAAFLLHVQGEETPSGFVAVTLGSDRRVTWAEVGASKAAMGMLVRALFAQ